ncbi:MAG: ArsR family transcriptional regulator [Calditrichaeota bacterium]|nr:MAG: ArsR family transcriptional regulator [Calditrichota bacterium]
MNSYSNIKNFIKVMVELTEEACIRKNVDISLLKGLQRSLHEKTDLEELANLLSMAGNLTRLKILFLLAQAPELCVCDMADVTGMTVSSISHQLSKLRAYGLIAKRREGQTIYYRLQETPFTKVLKQLLTLED